jgi:hypothetical protein
MKTLSNTAQIYCKRVPLYNELHVSAKNENFQALYEYNNIK